MNFRRLHEGHVRCDICGAGASPIPFDDVPGLDCDRIVEQGLAMEFTQDECTELIDGSVHEVCCLLDAPPMPRQRDASPSNLTPQQEQQKRSIAPSIATSGMFTVFVFLVVFALVVKRRKASRAWVLDGVEACNSPDVELAEATHRQENAVVQTPSETRNEVV